MTSTLDTANSAPAGPEGCPEAVTPEQLIAQVRASRTVADAAEVRILQLAIEWAHAHPEPAEPDNPGRPWQAPSHGYTPDGTLTDGAPDPEIHVDLDEEDVEWFGIPTIRWDAPASFAAANGMTTRSGKALIRDALTLTHRLPRTWALVQRGVIAAWRARQVAQKVMGTARDVTTYVDTEIAKRPTAVGPVILDRLLDEAMLRLYPEQRELDQLAALDARYAQLEEASVNTNGVVDMHLRGDWVDLKDFDDALSQVAAALNRDDREGEHGHGESLDVRRSIAVGVLADPERALALLHGEDPDNVGSPRKQLQVWFHLSEAAVSGYDVLAHDEDGRPMLAQVLADWCGRPDLKVTVRPVRDLAGTASVNGGAHDHDAHAIEDYHPSTEDTELVWLRDRHCVFPFCTRKARRCDKDHRINFDEGGPTCPCNLSPLCRHHHRLKTHAGWTYTAIEPGTYLWTDRHGQKFIRTRDGTRDVTPIARTG